MRLRHIAATVLALSLAAIPAAAAPVIETGDVLALEGGFTPIIGINLPQVMTFFDSQGRTKLTLENKERNFNSKPVSLAPDQLWFTEPVWFAEQKDVGGVLLSRDGRQLAGRFLQELRLAGPTDVVPMRSGDLLVAEHGPSFLPRIVRFTRDGRVVSVRLLPPEVYPYGVINIELLSDQCTVAWMAQYDAAWASKIPAERRRAVRTFDICKNAPGPDLMTLPFSSGAEIRQLPGGDFLVVPYRPNESLTELWRFSPHGDVIATYPVRIRSYALTTDGKGVWVYVVANFSPRLRRIDFAAPDGFAVDAPLPSSVSWLSVVGEYHASLQPLPPSRRRSAGH